MGTTFTVRREDGSAISGEVTPETACLCAQLAYSWEMYLEGSDRAELAACATPGCHQCGGTGVCPPFENDLSLDVCHRTSRALLALLGLASMPQDLRRRDPDAPAFVLAWAGQNLTDGEVPMPMARRMVMAARARFDRLAPLLIAAATEHHGAPRVREDGAVELRPVVGFDGGLTKEMLLDRLDRFASLVEEGARAGAVKVVWS